MLLLLSISIRRWTTIHYTGILRRLWRRGRSLVENRSWRCRMLWLHLSPPFFWCWRNRRRRGACCRLRRAELVLPRNDRWLFSEDTTKDGEEV